MISKKKVSSIIFAAGKSERMEFPKQFLKFNEEFTFIENIAFEFFNFGCSEIIIVVNERDEIHYADLKLSFCKFVVNRNIDLGRFYSVKIGLGEALKSDSDFFFLHNSDMPFVKYQTLDLLWKNKKSNSFSVPYFNEKGGHPILIPRKIAKYLKNKSEIYSDLKKELSIFEKNKIATTDDKILLNINTKETYNQYFNY